MTNFSEVKMQVCYFGWKMQPLISLSLSFFIIMFFIYITAMHTTSHHRLELKEKERKKKTINK